MFEAPPALHTGVESSGNRTASPILSAVIVDSLSGESIQYARFVFRPPDVDTSTVSGRHALNIGFKGSVDLPIPSDAKRVVMRTVGYLPSVVVLAQGQDNRIFVPLQRDPAYKRPTSPWIASGKDSSRTK